MMGKLFPATVLFAICLSHGFADETAPAVRAYASGEFSTAAAMLEPLASAGSAQAQHMLGYLYLRGRGVSRDEPAAFAWYRRASQQGLADAQFQLGFMYELGIGTARDPHEAEYWYGLAVEQGYCPDELSASGRFGDD